MFVRILQGYDARLLFEIIWIIHKNRLPTLPCLFQVFPRQRKPLQRRPNSLFDITKICIICSFHFFGSRWTAKGERIWRQVFPWTVHLQPCKVTFTFLTNETFTLFCAFALKFWKRNSKQYCTLIFPHPQSLIFDHRCSFHKPVKSCPPNPKDGTFFPLNFWNFGL